MDCGIFKRQEWQEVLYELSQCKMLKMIFTVDNAKSGVLFTDQSLDCYNFVCLQMDTFESFKDKELQNYGGTYTAKDTSVEMGLSFIF